MEPKEAFEQCRHGPWRESGLDVQWKLNDKGLFFQCTKSESDWCYNFQVAAVAYKSGNEKWFLHKGFLSMIKSAKDEILAELKGTTPPLIGGYSQGGALAILMYEILLWEYGIRVPALAFGAPACVWLSYNVSDRFKGVINYQNRGDIVPYSTLLIPGYHHVGRVEKIGPACFPTHKGHYPDLYERYL